MQTCPECGEKARDAHSFCPNCRTPLSAAAKETGGATRGSGSGSGNDDGTSGSETNVSRRSLMLYGGAAVGTAAVGAGGGFLLLSGGNNSGGRGPKETALSFYHALENGSVDEAEEMVHPDSPVQEIPQALTGQSSSGVNVSVDSTRLLHSNDTHAAVAITTNATFDGTSITQNVTVPLQRSNGEWFVVVERPS